MSEQRNKLCPHRKKVHGLTPVRCSPRFNNHLAPPCSQPLSDTLFATLLSPKQERITLCEEKEEKQRPANAPLISQRDAELQLSAESSSKCCNSKGKDEERGIESAREKAKCEYEALRKARMLENQARLESLGVVNTISQLRQQGKKPRPQQKIVYGLTPLRRSQRINNLSPPHSQPFKDILSTPPLSIKQETVTLCEENELKEEEQRPANAPFIKLRHADLQNSAESSARRCDSKGRGSVYNPVLGICCHFCRQKKLCGEEDCKRCGNFDVNEPCLGKTDCSTMQKKLCGEEDCKRCGNFDVNEPCLGKTDCSVCHSSNGVFCRACLKVRYGEEIEEVRENKEWMCPHCIEEKGINSYWICNSSICLRKRKMAPTGIAVYKAREMGYKSVAHLLMEELKRGKRS